MESQLQTRQYSEKMQPMVLSGSVSSSLISSPVDSPSPFPVRFGRVVLDDAVGTVFGAKKKKMQKDEVIGSVKGTGSECEGPIWTRERWKVPAALYVWAFLFLRDVFVGCRLKHTNNYGCRVMLNIFSWCETDSHVHKKFDGS